MREFILGSKLQNLVLFRHGKAQRPHEVGDDFDRELIERGKKEAYNQALRLHELGFKPDAVLVSSAARALQTWQSAEVIFNDIKPVITYDLYLASYETYLQMAINSGAENVIIIAHDPGLHELCRIFMAGNKLGNKAQMLLFELPTSGIGWFKRDSEMPNGMHLVKYLKPIKTAD